VPPNSQARNAEAFPILDDRLDNDDWAVITLYYEMLAPLKRATKELQGHASQNRFGAIWQVIPIYEELLARFEQLRQQYPVNEALLQQSERQKHREKHRQSELTFNSSIGNASQHVETQSSVASKQRTFEHHFSTNIRAGWQKLENYYTMLDDSPVYVAVIVLHPHMKWRWLEKSWITRPEWIDAAKLKFTKLTQRYQHVGGVAAPPEVNTLTRRRVDSDDDISDEEDEQAAGTIEQQVAQYLGERRLKSISRKYSPIPYWLGQQQRWPQLAALALDTFSTLVMSDEPERIFSEAGATIGTRRRLLGEETINYLLCLKSWIRSSIVSWGRYGEFTTTPLRSADGDGRDVFMPPQRSVAASVAGGTADDAMEVL